MLQPQELQQVYRQLLSMDMQHLLAIHPCQALLLTATVQVHQQLMDTHQWQALVQ
jgi:hypothetical protein